MGTRRARACGLVPGPGWSTGSALLRRSTVDGAFSAHAAAFVGGSSGVDWRRTEPCAARRARAHSDGRSPNGVGVEGTVSLHRPRRTFRSWSSAKKGGCDLPAVSRHCRVRRRRTRQPSGVRCLGRHDRTRTAGAAQAAPRGSFVGRVHRRPGQTPQAPLAAYSQRWSNLVGSNLRQKLRITLSQVFALSILATVFTADDSVAGPRAVGVPATPVYHGVYRPPSGQHLGIRICPAGAAGAGHGRRGAPGALSGRRRAARPARRQRRNAEPSPPPTGTLGMLSSTTFWDQTFTTATSAECSGQGASILESQRAWRRRGGALACAMDPGGARGTVT